MSAMKLLLLVLMLALPPICIHGQEELPPPTATPAPQTIGDYARDLGEKLPPEIKERLPKISA